jgi:hypothetical protein
MGFLVRELCFVDLGHLREDDIAEDEDHTGAENRVQHWFYSSSDM